MTDPTKLAIAAIRARQASGYGFDFADSLAMDEAIATLLAALDEARAELRSVVATLNTTRTKRDEARVSRDEARRNRDVLAHKLADARAERDAATAREKALRDDVARVEEIHKPVRVYDECDHPDDYGCEPVEVYDYLGCTASVIGWACETCCYDGEMPREDCPHGADHLAVGKRDSCPTRAALTPTTTEGGGQR